MAKINKCNVGIWPNRDPIGELGGLNLYSYVNNNPISHTDVYGLLGLYDTLIDMLLSENLNGGGPRKVCYLTASSSYSCTYQCHNTIGDQLASFPYPAYLAKRKCDRCPSGSNFANSPTPPAHGGGPTGTHSRD
jgi:hypothetical protein